ncbi:MAG: N-acetylmuramoyl-L-alanine amidase family 2 [Firmicutes bacterium]|nr:N-acetylmuramoyl-L-alanine amidase family 2 [Bacillota bacterium]
MLIPSELQLFFWVLGSLLVANVSMMAFFVLFAKLSESKLKGVIRRIILELDAFADKMENSEKRHRAIQQINETLGWKKFVIPSVLIGWVTDMEVAAIRKMQQSIDSSNRTDTRQVTLTELKQLALQSKNTLWSAANSVNRDVKLYLHWSGEHYGQFFDDYHINIDQDGSIHVTTNDFSQTKSHTYKRNTASIGICLACCYGATTDNFGSEPPTAMQIELNPSYESNGYPDGKYGPGFSWERWDLWYIPGVAKGEGGNVLRGKAIWYQYNGVGL